MPDIEDGATQQVEMVDTPHRPVMPDIGTDNAERIDRGRIPDIGEG